MSNTERVEKHFYPNGQLESELTYTYFKGSDRSWIIKHWHPNGVLESEMPVRNGVPEGVVKHWNEKGELIGQYEMREGTGVQKFWHPGGSLMVENSWVNYERTGRGRYYYEDREVGSETYEIRGRRVSKKKYLEACQNDPSLPRYDDISKAEPPKRKPKKATPAPAKGSVVESPLIQRMLSAPETKEVLGWLKSGQSGMRTLGELPDQESSIELAEEVYALGATKVWAVKIDNYGPDGENTGKLIVSLPKEPRKRKKVFAWCGEWAEQTGYDPEEDVGQEHLFVMLD